MSLGMELALCQLFVGVLVGTVSWMLLKLKRLSANVLMWNNGLFAFIWLILFGIILWKDFSFGAFIVSIIATVPLVPLEIKWLRLVQQEREDKEKNKSK